VVVATPASVPPNRRPKNRGARLHSRRGGNYQFSAEWGKLLFTWVGPNVAIKWGQAGLAKSQPPPRRLG
jgi:hypothetical protein